MWLCLLLIVAGSLLWHTPTVQANATDPINEIDLSICDISPSMPQKLSHEPFQLFVCVQQAGPRDVSNVQVTVEIPLGIEFVSSSYTKHTPTGAGRCNFEPLPDSKTLSGVVTCDSSPLNSGGEMHITLNLFTRLPQGYVFRAYASGDPWLYDSPANNSRESRLFAVIQRRQTEVIVDEFSATVEHRLTHNVPGEAAAEDDLLRSPAPALGAGGVQVRLQFITRREVEVASFRVLRRDITLGETVYYEIADLPPRGKNDAGARYTYIDTNLKIDHVYGYRLVVIGYDDIARVTPERKVTIDILRRLYLPLLWR